MDKSANSALQLFQEEIFGPVASVSSFTDEKEVVTRANSTPYGWREERG